MNQHLERIETLAPLLRDPVLTLIERARKEHGFVLGAVHGWRSVKEQIDLYQKGRRYDGAVRGWVIVNDKQIVTRAKPGRSAHNVITLVGGKPAALAADLCPIKPDGSDYWWDAPDAVWTTLYDIAADCGLDPLGDQWGEYLSYDMAHFQEPGWRLKLAALGLTLPDAMVMMQEA